MVSVALALALTTAHLQSAEKTTTDVPYRTADEISQDPYIKERCVLDVYQPKNAKNDPVVVWFHGGGLTGGDKFVPDRLKNQGLVVVAVRYRLSPKVKVRDCISDAAAAVAWTAKNISKYGGSADNIFVSGHSAGAYLSEMVTFDKHWLKPYGVDPDSFAGVVPFSGQAITHFTARQEKGIGPLEPTIDDLAPLSFIRKDCPPILFLTGDREKELYGRYEENAYLWRMFKLVGHPDCTLYELQGYDHGGMPEPGFPLLINFIHSHLKKTQTTQASKT